MKPFLHQKLTYSLLLEIASGAWRERRRFLSNREICKRWAVANVTATRSLKALKEMGLLQPVDRSGYLLDTDAQERALLDLHRHPSVWLPPRQGWSQRSLSMLNRAAKERAFAVILEHPGTLLKMVNDMPLLPPGSGLSCVKGFFQAAAEQKIAVHFYTDNGTAQSHSLIGNALQKAKPAAVAVFRRTHYYPTSSLAKAQLAANIPVIAAFGDCEAGRLLSIDFNQVGIGYRGMKMLLKHGHRRIWFPLPQGRFHHVEARLQGIRYAMAEADQPVELLTDELPFKAPLPASLRRRLVQPERRPTAIFATDRAMIQTLLPHLEQLDIHIPKTLSLLMCAGTCLVDDNGTEAVDTLFLDFEEVGRRAFANLHAFLQGRAIRRRAFVRISYQRRGTLVRPAASAQSPLG
ncbi:MAG TPA: substrate-binding domain-containing protein [Chthoniobacteraceae bacterium]|nr:substrate-binding domain-containing protein [Chthoniobacteraceae bacterium]